MRILLIDDEENLLVVLADDLTSQGCEVFTASDPVQGVSLAAEVFPDVVVTDLRMQSMDGIAVIKKIEQLTPDIPVVVLTAYAEVRTAVDAIKAGAVDYLTKPVDPEALFLTLKRVVHERRRESENHFLRDEMSSRLGYFEYLGESPEAEEVREKITRAAESDATIVITGESGTGKELVARLIHRQSERRDRPFLTVNCQEEDDFLLEELFARASRQQSLVKSKLEIVDGGSIMLDELTALSPELQSKLKRTIKDGVIEPGGGRRATPVNVRFFVSSTEDLPDAVSDGRLQADLYHEVNVLSIALPRLAQHRSDIPTLVRYLLSRKAQESAQKEISITDSALESLVQYEWPGNTRELFNTLEGAIVMSLDGKIKLSDLPSDLVQHTKSGQSSGTFVGLRDKLLAEERRLISKALEKNSYIQLRAAKALGISRSLLNQKIKRLEIEMPDDKD